MPKGCVCISYVNVELVMNLTVDCVSQLQYVLLVFLYLTSMLNWL